MGNTVSLTTQSLYAALGEIGKREEVESARKLFEEYGLQDGLQINQDVPSDGFVSVPYKVSKQGVWFTGSLRFSADGSVYGLQKLTLPSTPIVNQTLIALAFGSQELGNAAPSYDRSFFESAKRVFDEQKMREINQKTTDLLRFAEQMKEIGIREDEGIGGWDRAVIADVINDERSMILETPFEFDSVATSWERYKRADRMINRIVRTWEGHLACAQLKRCEVWKDTPQCSSEQIASSATVYSYNGSTVGRDGSAGCSAKKSDKSDRDWRPSEQDKQDMREQREANKPCSHH